MSATLFPEYERRKLEEKNDENLNSFTGIALDPEKNNFQVITGRYTDKKDMYEKLAKRGLVLRKCFESEIWEWIEKNAPDDLTAYLMYSTAFSKWKNNNVLGEYYLKLLKDLPGITREGTKGNPGTKGLNTINVKKESSLIDNVKRLLLEDEEFLAKCYVKADFFNEDKENITDTTKPAATSTYPVYLPQIENLQTKDAFKDDNFNRALANSGIISAIDGVNAEYSAVKLTIYADKNLTEPLSKEKLYSSNDIVNSYRNSRYRKVKDNNEASFSDEIKNYNIRMAELKKAMSDPNISEDERKQLYSLYTKYKKNFNDVSNIQNKSSSIKDQTLKNASVAIIDFLHTVKPNSILNSFDRPISSTKLSIFDALDLVIAEQGTMGSDVLSQYKTKLLNVKNRFEKEPKPDENTTNSDYVEYCKKLFEPDFELDIEEKGNKQVVKLKDTSIMQQVRTIATNLKEECDEKIENSRVTAYNNSELSRKRAILDKIGNYNSMMSHPLSNFNPKFGGSQQTEVDTLPRLQRLEKQLKINRDTFKEPQNKVKLSSDDVKKLETNNKDRLRNSYLEELSEILKAVRLSDNNITPEQEKRARWLNDALKKLDESIVTEAQVNDGANTFNDCNPYEKQLYNTQPGAILPLTGTIITEDTTNSELNSKLFDGMVLKSEVRNALLIIADKFKSFLDLPFNPVDIYFTGSCANYNYNDASDIDLHLVYDYEKAGINEDIMNKYVMAAKNNFNTKYNIAIKGIPVELGCENVATPLVSTGIYSLLLDKWISKPSYKAIEYTGVDSEIYDKAITLINALLSSNNSEKIESFVKLLGKIRRESLAQDGEFGQGNLLFKQLRSDGYLKQLKDAYHEAESKELSLESLEEDI